MIFWESGLELVWCYGMLDCCANSIIGLESACMVGAFLFVWAKFGNWNEVEFLCLFSSSDT